MFFIHLFCYAKLNNKNKDNIIKYVNLLNKKYLYMPFDNFESEYLDKIYDVNHITNYGNGIIYEIKNSIICTLKIFYDLNDYKVAIRNIILNFRNPITNAPFNTIYNLNNNINIDNWLNRQQCN